MQLSASVFDEVVQYLNTHEETLRIKKLIFCLCKKYWENDPNVVNGISTEELVQELICLRPSSEQLTFSVYKLVKTLNRPKVYAAVGKVIIDEVGKLYHPVPTDKIQQTDLITSVEQNLSEDQVILQNITNYLNTHPEVERLKKLIFATVKNKWENNLAIIDSYGLKNLLWDLRQNNSTQTHLKNSLYKIAENINKKTLYKAIADLILDQMNSLYIPVQVNETQIYDTQIIHVQPNDNSSNTQLDEASIIDCHESQIITEINVVKQIVPPVTPDAPIRNYDPFELRLDIIQYTNPLRAKIILYSVLFHPWDQSGQDWSTLNSYTLDDLLEQLLQKNCPLKELETRLYAAAKMLTDPDTNIQTAGIIVQSLQRII